MSEVVKEKILINEDYVKEYSPIPQNFNIDEVMPFAKTAELIHIRPIIGSTLYEYLLDVVNGDDEINEVDSTLLLNIYQAEAVAVYYEALPFIHIHTSEIGLTKGHSENSESTDLKDVNFILNQLKSHLTARLDFLKEFLDSHSDVYPLYENNISCCCKPKVKIGSLLYTTRKKKNELE